LAVETVDSSAAGMAEWLVETSVVSTVALKDDLLVES